MYVDARSLGRLRGGAPVVLGRLAANDTAALRRHVLTWRGPVRRLQSEGARTLSYLPPQFLFKALRGWASALPRLLRMRYVDAATHIVAAPVPRRQVPAGVLRRGNQAWHTDYEDQPDCVEAYTLFVYLCDVHANNGPTEFSVRQTDGVGTTEVPCSPQPYRLRSHLLRGCPQGIGSVTLCGPAGTVVGFPSRSTAHRGLVNTSRAPRDILALVVSSHATWDDTPDASGRN